MGWYCYDIYTSPKVECDRILTQKNENYESRVLKSYMKGNVYYAAVWQKIKNEEKQWDTEKVFAAIFLTNYSPKAKKGFNFGIKEMDETVGPCYYDFPEEYLKLLTPTNSKYAIEWREKVKQEIERKKKLSKLKIGNKIKFLARYDMTSGVKVNDEIILIKTKRGFMHGSFWKWPTKLIPTEFEIIKEDK